MAEEIIETEETEVVKSKEEMRHVAHEFVNDRDWCAVCGRSEGWKAHVKAELKTGEADGVEKTAIETQADGVEREVFISGSHPAAEAERAGDEDTLP